MKPRTREIYNCPHPRLYYIITYMGIINKGAGSDNKESKTSVANTN